MHKTTAFRVMLAALALALAVVMFGCDNKNNNTPSTGRTSRAAQLDDGQVAQVITTLNQGEISVAQNALNKLSAQSIKDYASEMVTEHTQANSQLAQLLQQQNIAARAHPVSQSLEQSAQQAITDLSAQTGANADRVYIDSQVKMHRMALALGDCVLLANDHNDALENTIRTQVRPTVLRHWQQAVALQASLGQNGGQGSDGGMATLTGDGVPTGNGGYPGNGTANPNNGTTIGPGEIAFDCAQVCGQTNSSEFDTGLFGAACNR